jgi:hypothetical protein
VAREFFVAADVRRLKLNHMEMRGLKKHTKQSLLTSAATEFEMDRVALHGTQELE